MKLGKLFGAVICAGLSVVLITQLYGCGAIIHPERRGQKSGTIDPGIAILDALWLFVFIIPGLVAFGIDFTTGAIFLPGGTKRSSASGDFGKMVVVKVKASELNEKTIREIVMKQTGCSELDMSKAKIYPLSRSESVEKRLAEISKSGYQAY
ncbi:MAG: hypothetical protein WCO26_08455 [Deltaproteobacteria bacterium]